MVPTDPAPFQEGSGTSAVLCQGDGRGGNANPIIADAFTQAVRSQHSCSCSCRLATALPVAELWGGDIVTGWG